MNPEVPCNRNEPDYPCVAPRWVKAAFHFSHWLIKTTFLAAKTDWTEKIAKEKTHRPKAHPPGWKKIGIIREGRKIVEV